jgi:hypothetical protein
MRVADPVLQPDRKSARLNSFIILRTHAKQHMARYTMMKVVPVFMTLLFVTACADQPQTSLGDSPVRDVRCPSFLEDEQCLARARRECGSENITVLSAPPQGEQIAQGHTVPIEGTIVYRIFTVRCEE